MGILHARVLISKFPFCWQVSNGLGAILGFIQLVIYACYYKSTPKKGNDDDFVKPKPTEVQHSGAAMA